MAHVNVNLDPDDTVYEPLHRAAVLVLRAGHPEDALAVLTWIANDRDRIGGYVAQVRNAVLGEATDAAELRAQIDALHEQLAAPSNRFEIPEIPAPPIVGTQLRDRYGYGWTVELGHTYRPSVGQVLRVLRPAPRLHQDPDPLMDPSVWGTVLPWGGVALAIRGPFDVIAQDPEDIRLYGPIGERWGNPGVPCPFAPAGCTLGLGHTGGHIDKDGNELPPLVRDLDPIEGSSTVVCTCQRPENHAPGCPRYVLAHGAIDPTRVVVPAQMPDVPPGVDPQEWQAIELEADREQDARIAQGEELAAAQEAFEIDWTPRLAGWSDAS